MRPLTVRRNGTFTVATVAVMVASSLSSLAEATPRILPDDVRPLRYDLVVEPNAEHLTFSAVLQVTLDVRRQTRLIKFNASELNLLEVSLSGNAKPSIRLEPEAQTVSLVFDIPVTRGDHTLTIRYNGKISTQRGGLFAVDYGSETNKKRALFTQFEPIDARRFLPCWDEPARKAVFALTAVVPTGEMAVSNMPQISAMTTPAGKSRVVFAPTPLMSPYLFFFGLGDFERISRRVGSIDVGVVVERGAARRASYALDTATELLTYYQQYFGLPYPLPKLDLIAGPGPDIGGMENWGAVFEFQHGLLLDPDLASAADRENVWLSIAHEVAHQWFGDLVTMRWWDGLWLNEGFTTWMNVKAAEHFHPEWSPWLDWLAWKDEAMELDARMGTHPIITAVVDSQHAEDNFDAITYEKGMSVVRMLEVYVGEDVWKAGVQAYFRRYQFSNTVTDDLWREIDAVSHRQVAAIAHAFTNQPGVPLIEVGARDGKVRLVQSRFALDAASRVPLVWQVPLRLSLPGNGSPSDGGDGLVIAGRAVIPLRPAGTIVNSGQAGYVRTLYRGVEHEKIEEAFPTLAAEDQIGLLQDDLALSGASYQPIDTWLRLIEKVSSTAEPQVWSTVVAQLRDIDGVFSPSVERTVFRSHARKVLGPALTTYGWEVRPNESSGVSVARADLIRALGEFDDPEVIARARSIFSSFVTTDTPIPPLIRDAIFDVVGRQADASTWDQVHALAQRESGAIEKRTYYSLLGDAADTALASRALTLAVSGEPSASLCPVIVQAVARNHPELAFDFAVDHFDLLLAGLSRSKRAAYFPQLLKNAITTAAAKKLRRFADEHPLVSSTSEIMRAQGRMAYRARQAEDLVPAINAWLAGQ